VFGLIAALIVSKTTGVPYVFEVHDRAPELECADLGLSWSSSAFKILKAVEKLVVIHSAGLITVNEIVADYFKQYGGPTPVAISTGTKIDIVNSRETTSKLSRKLKKHVILYQGNLDIVEGETSGYNLTLPLRAMTLILSSIPDTTLVYVGDGTGKDILQKKVKMMGLQGNVVLTGFLPRRQVFEWMKTANVLLIPYADSPNNRSTVPTKLYEYMAIGRPVVATRFPGIMRVLNHEWNGLLYSVNSVEEFAQCILRILNDPKLAKRLASNAFRDFNSKYSVEKNWPKLISLYDSIISNNNI
jgi:glycosyltransferase involved in cell wall biosynthesis